MKKEVQKLNALILRPEMYLSEDSLVDAVNFISGMNCGFEKQILDQNFYEWLINEYECERTSFGWMDLILSSVPITITNCERKNVKAFLRILKTYISHLEKEFTS